MKLHRALSILAIWSVVSLGASGQSREITIPELIQRTGKPVYQETLAEFLPQTLDELVSTADVLVHGRVISSQAYLTDDQTSLRTDYQLSPIRLGMRSAGFTLIAGQMSSPVTVSEQLVK